MKGFYFNCDWKNNDLLYVPLNLLVILEKHEYDEMRDIFDFDCCSGDDLKIMNGMLVRKEPIIVKNIEYKFFKEVEVSDKLLDELRVICLKGEGLDSIQGYGKCMQIFRKVEKELFD